MLGKNPQFAKSVVPARLEPLNLIKCDNKVSVNHRKKCVVLLEVPWNDWIFDEVCLLCHHPVFLLSSKFNQIEERGNRASCYLFSTHVLYSLLQLIRIWNPRKKALAGSIFTISNWLKRLILSCQLANGTKWQEWHYLSSRPFIFYNSVINELLDFESEKAY